MIGSIKEPKRGGLPAARMSDTDDHNGKILSGSPTVFVELLPQARVADLVGPPCGKPIVKGSATVFVNKLPAVRLSDKVACNGTIMSGAPRTFIGDGAGKGKKSSWRECLQAAASIGAATISAG